MYVHFLRKIIIIKSRWHQIKLKLAKEICMIPEKVCDQTTIRHGFNSTKKNNNCKAKKIRLYFWKQLISKSAKLKKHQLKFSKLFSIIDAYVGERYQLSLFNFFDYNTNNKKRQQPKFQLTRVRKRCRGREAIFFCSKYAWLRFFWTPRMWYVTSH